MKLNLHAPRSFRDIIFIGTIMIGIIPLLLHGLLTNRILEHNANRLIETEIALSSLLVQNRIAFMVSDTESKIEHIAMHLDQCLGDNATSLVSVAHLVGQITSWESLILLDPSGSVKDIFLPESLLYLREDLIGADFSRQPYFKDNTSSNRIYWSDAYYSSIQYETAIAITRQLKTGYQIIVTFTLENLYKLIDLDIPNHDIAAVLLDQNNVIIFHPEKSVIDFRETLSRQIKHIENSPSGQFQYQFGNNSYVGLTHLIPHTPWRLLLSINIEFIRNQKNEIAGFFTIGILSGLGIALTLAFRFYKIIQNHLRNLNSRIQNIKENCFDWEQADISSAFEEFSALESDFSQMARGLKSREDELEKQKLHYENLFNTGNDAIFLLDADLLHILDINQKAMEVTGLSKKSVMQTPFPKIVNSKDLKLLKQHRAAITENGHAIHDIQLLQHNGNSDYFEINSIRYPSTDKEFILSIARNIASRKKAEQLLETEKKKAEESNRSKDEFLAMISHELRTPLNSIIGFASLLEEEIKDKEQHELMRQIIASGDHLIRLFDDILDYSKLASGTIKIFDEDTSIEDIIVELDHAASLMIKKSRKPMEFLTHIHSSCPNRIRVDKLRVQQVLMNISSNAIKFTEEGKVELRVKALPEAENEPLKLEFTIRDTGIGMNPIELDKMWEPFHQNDASYKRNHEGVGLGLAICMKLTVAMKGGISCKSKPGKGTEFTVVLPYTPV